MKHSNISIFVPHIGCPHKCSFCDQRTITGTAKIPHGEDVKKICEKALGEVKDPQLSEIAFFGGSFTAVPREYMLELLESAVEFVGENKFSGIRLSTRPDYISEEILDILKAYKVTSIELGAQSMSDKVLEANERGHSAEDVFKASELIRKYGFELGLQMMVGLYKSSIDDELQTIDSIMKIKPDTLRIYPVVILENTKLGELFKSGKYKPMQFDDVVLICCKALEDCEKENIRVIKCGLHASEFVEQEKLGGFYHPAFREICEGRLYLRKIAELIGSFSYGKFSVPAKNLSKALGQKKCNIEYLKNHGKTVEIIVNQNQKEEILVIERR